MISLDLRGASIDDVLRIFAQAAGLTIVKDPELNAQLTIICPRPVTIDEALEILNAELSVIGYTTVRQGQVLKVTILEDAIKMTTETHIGTDPEAIAPGDRLITQIVPLQTLDASVLTEELGNFSDGVIIPNLGTNTLYITASASNVKKLLGLIIEMEKRSAASVRRFQLKYVLAEEVSDLLTDYLLGVGGGGTGVRPTYERNLLPRRTQLARPATPARPAAAVTAGGGSGGVQVLVDTRTNSLIVQASPERLETAADFLAAIDVPVDYSSNLAVIPLKYALPEQIADRLTTALGGTSAAKTTTSTRTPARTTSPGTATRSSAFRPDNQSPLDNPGVVLADGTDGSGGLTFTQSPAGAAPEGGGNVVPIIDMSDVIIVPDPATSSLIVNASPEKLQLIRQLVEKLDVIPTQVMVQAIIAEVTLTKSNQLGIEWTLQSNNIFGTGASGELSTNFGTQQTDSDGNAIPLLGLTWSVLNPDRFEGIVNALGKNSNVRILSTPKVVTTSGEMATIDVSTQVPFAKGQITSDTGGVTTSFDYQSVGIVLEVTPSVSQDGMVSMEISQTADDLLRYDQLSPDLKLPVVSKRYVGAKKVTVQDGHTVVLGGLMSDRITRTATGIPVLKDLPLLGWLFRNRETVKEKTELLVFLTPYVTRTPEESQMLTDRERGRAENLKNLPVAPNGPEQ